MFDSTNDPQAPNPPRAERIQLTDGFSAPREYYEQSVTWIDLRLPGLPPGIYTVEKLAGKEYWAELSDGDRKLFGRCIAHAIGRGLLDLEFWEGKHEYPKLYRVKQDRETDAALLGGVLDLAISKQSSES